MPEKLLNFLQDNSPDGGFLQSNSWRKFQEEWGRKTFHLEEKDERGGLVVYATVVRHTLPIAGKYFYVPRGPVTFRTERKTHDEKEGNAIFLRRLIKLAKENNAGWIRVEPNSGKELNFLKESLPENSIIKKSSVDMQPKKTLVIDISKDEEELLAGMKQKTRYNLKLSQKRGVQVKAISNFQPSIFKQYIEEFLRLVKITAARDKITSHPENYYRKMFEIIPSEILKLYIAEYKGGIIAANIVLFFGNTATYMHGASDNIHRQVMSPYLLQWQAILDAKKAGCTRYDLGGVRTEEKDNRWLGITKFKTGFAPATMPIQFPGCYDIILKPARYSLYRFLQSIRKRF